MKIIMETIQFKSTPCYTLLLSINNALASYKMFI